MRGSSRARSGGPRERHRRAAIDPSRRSRAEATMNPRTHRAIACLLALMLAACSREPAPAPQPAPAPPPAPVPAAPLSFVSADPPAPDGAAQLRITAPAAHPLYLHNCNGAFSWGLEHRVDGAW